jgi:hypothetical protein
MKGRIPETGQFTQGWNLEAGCDFGRNQDGVRPVELPREDQVRRVQPVGQDYLAQREALRKPHINRGTERQERSRWQLQSESIRMGAHSRLHHMRHLMNFGGSRIEARHS